MLLELAELESGPIGAVTVGWSARMCLSRLDIVLKTFPQSLQGRPGELILMEDLGELSSEAGDFES